MFKKNYCVHNIIEEDNMTQKELAYLEDAIGHETSIINILNETSKNLVDDQLIAFVQSEMDEHASQKQQLMNLLEEKAHE